MATIDTIVPADTRSMTYAAFNFLHLTAIEVYADWDWSPETGSVCYPAFKAATIYRFGRAYHLTGERLRRHVEKLDLADDLISATHDAFFRAAEASR
jgi:hypothetical protein